MTPILRLIAIAIAIAGVIDPAISLSGETRARLAVVALDSASPAAIDARARLVRDLSSSYEITAVVTSDAAAAVVIGERLPTGLPDDGSSIAPDEMLVATVTTPPAPASAVRIVRVEAPREVPASTVIHLGVELAADAAAGRTTDITAAIDGFETGRASHRWTAGETRWRAAIDAVPVGDPPYALRISGGSNVVDVVVDARRSPFRIQFYDPRPSWATTFLRRALEADPRFEVASLSLTSRGVSTRTGAAVPIGDAALDRFDVVVAGGVERLTAADARALEQFMRDRGGAVVLVPDERISAGAAHDLLAGADVVERLVEEPASLAVTPPAPPLESSEMLVVRALTPGARAIARLPGDTSTVSGSPVIVAMPRGAGTLMLSGAMDAWRFRAANSNAFDRFWQSTIAGLALAVPPAVAIDVEPPLLRPDEPAMVTVRVRSRAPMAVSAAIDGHRPIRLLPQPEAGVYRGRFTAPRQAGRSTLEVRAAGAEPLSSSRPLLVRPDAAHPPSGDAPALSMLSSSHRGIDVTPERIAELERFLRGAVRPPRSVGVRHPMRSTWWIAPFVGCLSAEWWIRRRRGRR